MLSKYLQNHRSYSVTGKSGILKANLAVGSAKPQAENKFLGFMKSERWKQQYDI